jgi:hypothetical protein
MMFVTKTDLALKTDLVLLKSQLEADIHKLKAELLKWLLGAVGFQTIVIIGALFTIMRSFR